MEMVVQPETSWASVRSRLQGTSVFSAVEDEKAQKDLFDEVVAEFKAEEKKQSGIELDFRSMLRGKPPSRGEGWMFVYQGKLRITICLCLLLLCIILLVSMI